MPNFFPCPNPACTYQFDAEQLPAAAMVTCPICRTRFPYRAASAAAPTTANDFPATEPDDNPFGSPATPSDRPARVNRLVTPRDVKRSRSTTAAFMAIGAAIAVAAILGALLYALRGGPFKEEKKKEEIANYDNGNFKFRMFDKDVWTEDSAIKNAMKSAGIGMRRKDPDAWIVVHFRDYKTRQPRPDEVRNELLAMLRSSMPNAQHEPLGNVTVGETPAQGTQFTATYAGLEVYGQAFTFSHQGIGYVLVFFATDWDKAQAEIEKYRNSFAFLENRKNWRESEPDATPFFEKDMLYQLQDYDSAWIKGRILGDKEQSKGREYARDKDWLVGQDPNAKMFYKTNLVKDPKKAREAPEALGLVLELDKPGNDPLETARAYMKAALEKEEGEGAKVTFEPVKPVGGAPLPKSDIAIGLFSTTTDRDNKKKSRYALGAMPMGDKLIVAVTWCREDVAEFLEGYMLKMVSSLQERK